MISLPFSLQVACKPKKEIILVYIGLACKKSKEHPQKCINKMLQIQRRKKSYVFFFVVMWEKGLGHQEMFPEEGFKDGQAFDRWTELHISKEMGWLMWMSSWNEK